MSKNARKLKVSPKKLATEMHLPPAYAELQPARQIVADLKYRKKIAEKVFSVNLRAFDRRIPLASCSASRKLAGKR